MRGFVHRALLAVSFLKSQPTGPGTGVNATKVTEVDALKLASRLSRYQFSGKRGMSLPDLITKSRQRRRGRQTKPGKR